MGRPAHRPGIRPARHGTCAAVADHRGRNAIEQQVEQKVQANTDAQIKAQIQQSAAQLQEQNQVLANQVEPDGTGLEELHG